MRGKKPWYVWLSVFGFVYVMIRLQRLLIQEDESWREGMRRCVSFWWRCLYRFAGQVLLPAALLMGVWQQVAWPTAQTRTLGLAVVWLLVYVAGVIAAWRMENWRREIEG